MSCRLYFGCPTYANHAFSADRRIGAIDRGTSPCVIMWDTQARVCYGGRHASASISRITSRETCEREHLKDNTSRRAAGIGRALEATRTRITRGRSREACEREHPNDHTLFLMLFEAMQMPIVDREKERRSSHKGSIVPSCRPRMSEYSSWPSRKKRLLHLFLRVAEVDTRQIHLLAQL